MIIALLFAILFVFITDGKINKGEIKNGKGEKRSDGYYTVTLTIGTDKDGKAKRKYFYSKVSRKDAIAKRNAWMQEHPYDEQPTENLEALTVEQWAERWRQGYKSVLDDNTQKMYTTQVNGAV